ncbi:hypothetical protein [Fulvivirga lutimaris]|uniref:hypothetical protein n=1 Tax=Fulvivirga lutimaris TaxID=1819566 RepID=UPI0012BBFA32|nr:hypothetical protein [Fulvivirga lutimaris]MTI41208.1 hypothetical protein [Fulvivirga lutimaris]
MAQFKPFADNVKVLGQTVTSLIDALDSGKEVREQILAKHGISNIDPEKWYSQEAWLKAFEEISNKVGPSTIFMIGKSIPESAKFPPEIDSLEKGLGAINMAYKMNHKGGDIGYYKLVSFDPKAKKAVMECNNPYPSDFDRGIITTMARKFRPKNSFKLEVNLDTSKPTRLSGADSCTYNIEW